MAVSADTPVSAGNLKAVVAKLKEWTEQKIAGHVAEIAGTFIDVKNSATISGSGITFGVENGGFWNYITFQKAGTYDYSITVNSNGYNSGFEIQMPNGSSIANPGHGDHEYGRAYTGRVAVSANQKIFIGVRNANNTVDCTVQRVA